MKFALGAGGGDASDIDAVDSSGGSSGGSSRSATPDNGSAAAREICGILWRDIYSHDWSIEKTLLLLCLLISINDLVYSIL